MKPEHHRLVLYIIGIYQILGGLLGWYAGIYQGFNNIINHFFIFIIIIVVFAFSIYCGVLLLSNKISSGINLSLINQFLQLAQFKIFGFGFEYVAGSYLAIGFSDTPVMHLQYKYTFIKSGFFISSVTGDNEINVMFNFIAILIFAYLYNLNLNQS